MLETLDRFCGCLLGLAVGDALGAPLDGLHEQQIQQQYGRVTEMLAPAGTSTKPGQVTGPTKQMLCVLDSYTESGTFDPHDVAERLVGWFQQNPAEACAVSRLACSKMAEGYTFERAAQDSWKNLADNDRMSAACLVRVAPAALLHYPDEIHLIGESRVLCGLTHFDERCKMSSACLGLAVSHLLLAEVHSLVDELLVYAGPRNPVLGHSLGAVPHLGPGDLRTVGLVQDILQAAVWVTLFCESFEEGLVLLVNKGGEASLCCAVAGAMLGARFGVEAIPKRWLDVLQLRQHIDRGARRLYELSERGA